MAVVRHSAEVEIFQISGVRVYFINLLDGGSVCIP